MGRLLLAVLVAVVGCGPATSGSSLVPHSSPSASSPAAAASGPTSGPPKVGFTCSLPVVWSPYQPGAGNPSDQWGLVNFPAGTLSVMSAPLPTAMPFSQWPGLSFDRAAGRWLPAPHEAVSPDGLRYAYADYDPPGPNDGKAVHANSGRVHLVDASSGRDTIVFSGSPSFEVVDVTTDAIYLTQVGIGYTPTARGLYRLNQSGGSPQLMPGSDLPTDPFSWTLVGMDSAWAVGFASGNVDRMGSGDRLIRYDLRSGATDVWLDTDPSNAISIIGVDTSARPIVVVSPYATAGGEQPSFVVSVVTGKSATKQIAAMPAGPGSPWIADAHGIWMSASDAIWLYQPDGTLTRFPIDTGGQVTSPIAVSGGCA